jgi:hypothetical protein
MLASLSTARRPRPRALVAQFQRESGSDRFETDATEDNVLQVRPEVPRPEKNGIIEDVLRMEGFYARAHQGQFS